MYVTSSSQPLGLGGLPPCFVGASGSLLFTSTQYGDDVLVGSSLSIVNGAFAAMYTQTAVSQIQNTSNTEGRVQGSLVLRSWVRLKWSQFYQVLTSVTKHIEHGVQSGYRHIKGVQVSLEPMLITNGPGSTRYSLQLQNTTNTKCRVVTDISRAFKEV